MKSSLLVLLFFSLSFQNLHAQSQADFIDQYFSIFKNMDIGPTGDHGLLCEKLAQHKIEQEFPTSEYETFNGLTYKEDQRIRGELDIVVVRNSDEEAVLVAEVKCWVREESALSKARRQLDRFFGYVNRDRDIDIYESQDASQTFETDSFDEQPEIRTIAQFGAMESGFDQELDLTLNSVKTLLRKIKCHQGYGNCQSSSY